MAAFFGRMASILTSTAVVGLLTTTVVGAASLFYTNLNSCRFLLGTDNERSSRIVLEEYFKVSRFQEALDDARDDVSATEVARQAFLDTNNSVFAEMKGVDPMENYSIFKAILFRWGLDQADKTSADETPPDAARLETLAKNWNYEQLTDQAKAWYEVMFIGHYNALQTAVRRATHAHAMGEYLPVDDEQKITVAAAALGGIAAWQGLLSDRGCVAHTLLPVVAVFSYLGKGSSSLK